MTIEGDESSDAGQASCYFSRLPVFSAKAGPCHVLRRGLGQAAKSATEPQQQPVPVEWHSVIVARAGSIPTYLRDRNNFDLPTPSRPSNFRLGRFSTRTHSPFLALSLAYIDGVALTIIRPLVHNALRLPPRLALYRTESNSSRIQLLRYFSAIPYYTLNAPSHTTTMSSVSSDDDMPLSRTNGHGKHIPFQAFTRTLATCSPAACD
jgi:hypothetical protein